MFACATLRRRLRDERRRDTFGGFHGLASVSLRDARMKPTGDKQHKLTFSRLPSLRHPFGVPRTERKEMQSECTTRNHLAVVSIPTSVVLQLHRFRTRMQICDRRPRNGRLRWAPSTHLLLLDSPRCLAIRAHWCAGQRHSTLALLSCSTPLRSLHSPMRRSRSLMHSLRSGNPKL